MDEAEVVSTISDFEVRHAEGNLSALATGLGLLPTQHFGV